MAYSIRLPDGTLVENIPDDLSPEEAKKRIIKAFPQFAPPTSVTRRVLGDVPVGIAQGATTGVRMIADAFGADNAVSQSLKGAEEYLGGLLSAQATNNLDAMAKILKEAEDKGVLDQVKAGAQALAEAPVEVVSQFLGTAAPTILAGVGGVMARLGATGIGALQAGTGATMGAGLIKGNIYEVVKDELTNAGVDPKIAEERAKFAQNYTGENWDQILLGTGLGAAAALGPLERIFARVPAIPTGLAAKNMVTRGVAAGVMEAAPEATQAFQEQVAANIALQREGFDVPTFRGAVANATLEGLAGFGVGAPIGMMSRRQKVGEAEPGAEQRAEETKRTQEGIEEATPPTAAERPQEEGLLPGMVQPEPELTPEDEAELQARIAGAPPPPPAAAVTPILPGPPPAPAPAGALIPTEPSVTPQAAPPVAAPEPQVEQLEMLKAQLAQIQQARLDPTLSIDDYEAIEELDRRESEIFRQIQALTPQPPIVPTPVEQLPEIDNVAKQQPAPAVALQQPVPLPAPPAAPAITPPPAVTPPTAPPVTPPAAVTPQVVPPIETPTEVRDQRTVQTELNRVRQSLRQMETAFKKKKVPESEVTRLQNMVNALEQELEEAKPSKRVPVFRSKEGNTWTGTGNAPAWLRKKLDQGMDLEDFRIRPELDNKSEDEIGEMEKPYGFGRPMPETRPPKELEDLIAQSEEARKESPNLFNMLRGKITPEDVEDITPEANLNFLKAPRGRGRDLSDVVNDGTLDAFLEVPHDAPNFDLTEATEFIKDLLRQDFKEDPTLMMSQETRAQLEYFGIKISELEAELEPEDVNRELQAVYAEERAIAQETEAAALEEQERGPAVPTGPPEFALEGETLDQARARTERAEAEREEFERRRVADLERDVFALQPTPAAPAAAPVATGDLFGAAGMADQPSRTAPTVAPTPIETEAAKIPPIEEAIEAELKKAGYDDLDKMSKQIKDEFGVSKPVADAYARAVQNARIQHIRAQYGEITAEQLMEALNTRDSLRRRIDGIVKRLEAAKPREGRPVEVQTWDVFYTGTNNLAAENVEAPSAQKAKAIAAVKEGLKSTARLTAKKKEKRIKTEAAPTEKGKFTLAKDGIDGFEIEPSRVPDGNDAFQYAVGRDLNRVTFGSLEGVFRRRADERGTYGGWRYLTRVDKLIPEKSEPKKEEKKLTGAYRLAERQQNAGDRFIDSVMEQFGLTKDQAQNALNRLMKEKVVSLDPVDGQFKLKDGRFWDKEVMLRAAGVETEAKPEAPKVSESIGRAYQNASGMIYGKTWTNSLNNQHRARLGARLRDEGYTEREAKDIVEEAVKVQSDRRLPQMDFLQLRDLLIAGKTLGLEEVPSKKPEPKKEPPAGPTFAGMQAEIDRLKAEAKSMGIELDQQTFVRDTAAEQEKKAKKEAKKRELRLKQATRNEIEYARFDDLSTDPIQATPEQLKLAKQLADGVNGELVFYDKDLNLGLVTVANKMGFDEYFPIHDGIISKVDVSDYTGLSVMDKSFLKRIKNSLEILKGTKPDFGTLYSVEFDMPGDRQKDLFGSTSEAKQIGEIMEVKGKKLPPGRSPELAAAARAVQAGTMSAEEYNKLVDVYKPIPVYAEPLRPATAEQVFDALDVKKREQINPQIPNGTKVGLRLDIPAFNRKGVFVVSIHQKRTASAPGKVIGYGSVAKAKNVTFGVGNQLKALEIAAGAAKDALQTIEGEYVNVSPEQAFAEAQRAIKDPSYVQVGIDPTRHAYFFDRRTTLPVVSAEEVIQIGNMILAKNPTFGKKADFLYNIEGGPIAGDTQPDDATFFDRLRKEESEKREIERQEKIAYYASIRRKEVALQQRVRDYGSTLETQRQLNNLSQIAQTLKEDIDLDKPRVYTAESFLRQARAAVDGVAPYKEQAISPDVFAVIQAVYMDDPRLLEGLRLSIKPEFSKKDEELRRAFGIRGAAGAFQPIERIVNLYTGTKGVTNPMVIRHELTHTLEQMMTGPQRMAIFNSYMDALKKAIKKNKDPKAQEFFDNVLKFLDKPNAKNKEAVTKTTPSYALYQFVNPSEYWAVNAEKLMAQRLGTQWDRFKKAVRKMFEKMKDIFGFNNQFAVHDVFDKIMSGSKERLGRDSIAAYIASSGEQFEFLNSIKEDSDLIAKYGHGDTPMLDVAPAKRIMLKTATMAKDSFKDMVENPSEILRMTFNPLVRGITYLRNKNIWFGTGLNEADRIRYNGQVRTAEGLATASLALDNMIRGGNIATQVLFQGGIEYNPNTLMFGAVKKEKNMTKVYEAEAALKKKLGDQLGTNIIQGYLVAKRSKNIKDDVEYHEMALENVNEDIDLKVQELKALDANPNATEKQKKAVNRELRSLFAEAKQIQKDYDTIKKIAEDKVTMSDTEIEDFIAREKVHPELKEILNNFTAVNQNLLKFWRQVGLLSQPRYERLAGIKDYVPWYRIMADEEDVHSPIQATTRSATNIGKEKLFGPGKPSVVDDFVIEENQNVFKIQPAKVNAVKLNSKRLKPGEYTITPQGEMTLNVPYKPGDVLIIQSERQIENIIDNMTRNVMRMTMNGLRQYAAQRIVSEYATRGADGKILTFKEADLPKGRFDFINNGRRTVVEIQDPLITEAALGMQTVGMQMWKPLAAAANFTRRTITLSPVFQVRQVFKDAPTAALVTGVKNPAALVGGVYKGFISALRDSDPASSILRSAGIGGFYSPARTPEADVKRQIGIINNSTYDYVIKALDHVGDSSDIAQRIAIYNRVMAETGDEALALYQSANVINFLRHGSGQVAQALVQTVPFLNAYAQSIDVLYNALVGGGLRGLDRKKAMQRLFVTGSLLAGTTILYAMLVGDDDEYMKMDDQSKIRNYMIPGTDVILPMNTSAAFFFKAIPELVYNKVVNEGTENAIDEKRLRTALKEAAVDLLLGPTPIPSAVKPVVEISLNRDFFTSRPVVPAGLQDLDAYQQYDMRTSDAGKLLSALTGTEANRLLNPIEADHLIRGIFGTVGGMVAWSSNLIGTSADYRPEMGLKEMPITGPFLRPPVPRGREDLFYALKESTDQKYKTFNRLVDRDPAEAEAYLNRHPNLIAFYDYTSKMDVDLKEINAAIRFIGEIKDPSYTPEQKRKEILELMNLKQEILEGVEQFRKEAYAD